MLQSRAIRLLRFVPALAQALSQVQIAETAVLFESRVSLQFQKLLTRRGTTLDMQSRWDNRFNATATPSEG
jgi:hypothetical protein